MTEDETETERTRLQQIMTELDPVLDRTTDTIAILVIGAMVLYGYTPTIEVLSSIVAIALGAKGAKAWTEIRLS